MVDDLISRQAAIKAIEDLQNCYNGFSDTYDKSCIIGVLEELPSAQRKGKWLLCGNHHLCSECDEWALTRWDEDECDEVDILTNYCPNCGADMRGEQDG